MRNPASNHSTPSSSAGHPLATRKRIRAFTLIEVAVSTVILALCIATSITTLQFGIRSVDTARNMTLASQIMQSQMEILRLQNWSQIVALQQVQIDAGFPTTPITVEAEEWIGTGTATPLDDTLTELAENFNCTRLVTDISGRSDIKLITLNVAWNGVDGRAHSLSYQTRYAKNGLSDYFYVAH
jgi:type II secretory pathway pseudopilin PulG